MARGRVESASGVTGGEAPPVVAPGMPGATQERAWLRPGGEEGTEFCGGAAEFGEGCCTVSDDEGVEGGRAGVVAVNRLEGEAARGGSCNHLFGGMAGG